MLSFLCTQTFPCYRLYVFIIVHYGDVSEFTILNGYKRSADAPVKNSLVVDKIRFRIPIELVLMHYILNYGWVQAYY